MFQNRFSSNMDMEAMMAAYANTTGMPNIGDFLPSGKPDQFFIPEMLLAAFGLPGNILTIVVLCSSKQLRVKPINIFLIHQSIIDLLVGLFRILEEVLIKSGVDGTPVICQLFTTEITSAIALYTSTYNITFLTIERFLAITNPLHYDAEKVRRRLPFVFLFNWLFCIGAVIFIPIFTITRDGYCLIVFNIRDHFVIRYYYSPHLFTISLMIPLTVMVFCYTRMFIALRSSMKMSTSAASDSKTVHKSRLAQVNIFETCLIMTIIFVICWTTAQSALLLNILKVYTDSQNYHFSIGRLMVLFNSCLNPYIYAIRYRDFKQQLRALCT